MLTRLGYLLLVILVIWSLWSLFFFLGVKGAFQVLILGPALFWILYKLAMTLWLFWEISFTLIAALDFMIQRLFAKAVQFVKRLTVVPRKVKKELSDFTEFLRDERVSLTYEVYLIGVFRKLP